VILFTAIQTGVLIMSDVTLSKAVRSNLLHLQNTAKLMDITQERLATGKKVNSALDNPTNFFTSEALNARAADIGTLLDAMSNGIQTIEAADNGLTAITKTIESMQSTLRQARQDNTFQVASFSMPANPAFTAGQELTFSGGSVGDPSSVALTKGSAGATSFAYAGSAIAYGPTDTSTFSINVDGAGAVPVTINQAVVQSVGNGDDVIDSIEELTAILNKAMGTAGVAATATHDGTNVTISANSTGASSSIAISDIDLDADGGGSATTLGGFAAGTPTPGDADGGASKTVDELVTEINTRFKGQVRASNDNGKLRLENLSTSELSIDGISSAGVIDAISTDQAEIGGNNIRANLAKQFNELRSELDRLAEDASYNGVNLLRGDALKIVFNELGTSMIEIQTRDAEGNVRPINSNELELFEITEEQLDSDASIDGLLNKLQLALGEVRSQASDLGSTLSTVQNRENFTKQMINTLQTGAANLTLADTNEEGANMLALQTRQQLSQTALSLASQADQAVLRLFG
jgi:flagellin-like hook-associated protein FlgL